MAQWIKDLLHKREDLSSDPRSPCKMGEAAKVCNPGALMMRGKAETEAGWHREWQVRNFPAGWKVRTSTLVCPPISTHLLWHVHAHIHTHECTHVYMNARLTHRDLNGRGHFQVLNLPVP